MGEKVSIKFKDYRDIDNQYSNIASIEMFEAVGKKYWEKYFHILSDSLINSGRAALQIITIDEKRSLNYQNRPDIIQQYIFPGGMLPAPGLLCKEIKAAGLQITDTLFFGRSYAESLRRWDQAFQQNWSSIQGLGFDQHFYRMWRCLLYTSDAADE